MAGLTYTNRGGEIPPPELPMGLWGGKPIRTPSMIGDQPTVTSAVEKALAEAARLRGDTLTPTETTEAAPVNVDMLYDYDDHVTALFGQLERRDRNSWELGKIAAHFEVTVGRPTNEDKANEVPTLHDLAMDAGCSPQRLGEWRNNYGYWPDKARASVGFDEPPRWELWNQVRRFVDSDETRRNEAADLLRHAAKHHYSADLFSDYLGNLRFYPPEVLNDKRYAGLDMLHFAIARKASAGQVENAVELLETALLKGLDVAAFRAYCAQPKPAPVVKGSERATTFVVPDSTVWDGEYFDAIREFLPDDVRAGDTFEIIIRKL